MRDESGRWAVGDAVVMRHVRGEWNWATPMRVVEDRGDFVALYLQPGSVISRMGDTDRQPTRAFAEATTRIPMTWGIKHALHLIRFGDEHATVLYWDERSWESVAGTSTSRSRCAAPAWGSRVWT